MQLGVRRHRWLGVPGLLVCVLTAVPAAQVPDSKFFDSNGVQIHYADQGKGKPVVLLHGFLGTMHDWYTRGYVPALLDAGYRVLALDARGHGRSDKPHDPAQYGPEMARDIVRLMDHVGIDKAHVVGYSMGGDLALKLLGLHPERLLSVTLGGIGGNPLGGWVASDFDLRTLATSLEHGDGIKPLIREPSTAGDVARSEEQIDRINEQVMSGKDAKALAAAISAYDQLSVSRDVLRRNTVPAIVIVGEHDPERVETDGVRGVIANVEYVVISGADHSGGSIRR